MFAPRVPPPDGRHDGPGGPVRLRGHCGETSGRRGRRPDLHRRYGTRRPLASPERVGQPRWEAIHSRRDGLRGRAVRLRQRRLAGHLSRQRQQLRPRGARHEAHQLPVPQQRRRHVHRRHGQGGAHAIRLGAGAAASATTTTTGSTICSSPTGASNVLYRNNGNGTFTDVSEKAGVAQAAGRWGAGCCFLDYDRDGHLDLFVPVTSTSIQRRRRVRAMRPTAATTTFPFPAGR